MLFLQENGEVKKIRHQETLDDFLAGFEGL
jgi:hypothetical protein